MNSLMNVTRSCLRQAIAPLLGLLVFLMIWQVASSRIDTMLGKFPGPMQVVEQAQNLVAEHRAQRAKGDAFSERQELRIAERLAVEPDWQPVRRQCTLIRSSPAW